MRPPSVVRNRVSPDDQRLLVVTTTVPLRWASTAAPPYPKPSVPPGFTGVTSVHVPVVTASLCTLPLDWPLGPGASAYVTYSSLARLSYAARIGILAAGPAGCPATGTHLVPSAVLYRVVADEVPSPSPQPAYRVRSAATRTVTPWPEALGLGGKPGAAAQVLPRSVDLRRPSWRVPSHRVSLLRGSTRRRSPVPRPSSLDPSFTLRLVRVQVAPRSSERRNAPLPAHDCA